MSQNEQNTTARKSFSHDVTRVRSREAAEKVKARLEEAMAGSFFRPTFIVWPDMGELVVTVYSDHEDAGDSENGLVAAILDSLAFTFTR